MSLKFNATLHSIRMIDKGHQCFCSRYLFIYNQQYIVKERIQKNKLQLDPTSPMLYISQFWQKIPESERSLVVTRPEYSVHCILMSTALTVISSEDMRQIVEYKFKYSTRDCSSFPNLRHCHGLYKYIGQIRDQW